jgi:hypothetical protein
MSNKKPPSATTNQFGDGRFEVKDVDAKLLELPPSSNSKNRRIDSPPNPLRQRTD